MSTDLPLIKKHKELADYIAGKNVLVLNSYGKDSVLCLEWLRDFAYPGRVVSLHMEPLVPHPDDASYEKYLKKEFSGFEFEKVPNPWDVTNVACSEFQAPGAVFHINREFEYIGFEPGKLIQDVKKRMDCEFVCSGESRSESFSRAIMFNKKGLLVKDHIYPLGMMKKDQVFSLIGKTKLHPVYKLMPHTLDTVSYYKMRSTFLAKPEYYEQMKKVYPMIELDKYRWEVLLREKN